MAPVPYRWPAEGWEVRTATPCGAGGVLSSQQVAAYVRDGFLLVSGLIAEPHLSRAVDAMWRQMEARPHARSSKPPPGDAAPCRSLRRDDPSTWDASSGWDSGVAVFSPELLDSFTTEYLVAANLLADANTKQTLFPVASWHRATRPPPPHLLAGSSAPPRGYPAAIAKFPESGGQHDCAPHCDYGDTGDRGWRVSPQPIPIQVLTYLGGSGAAGGGHTLCWPRAHRALARRYLSDPARYEWRRSRPATPRCAGRRGLSLWSWQQRPAMCYFWTSFVATSARRIRSVGCRG